MHDEVENKIFLVSEHEDFFDEVSLFFRGFEKGDLYQYERLRHEDLSQASSMQPPKAIILDCNCEPDTFFPIIRKFLSLFPKTIFVCSGNMDDANTVISIVQQGVQHFLKYPLRTEDVQNLLNIFESHDETGVHSTSEPEGVTLAVASPKGGTGVTFLTTNLAIALAEISPQKKIAVVDCRPQSGDVATYLDLKPQYTLRDLVDHIDQVDESFLEGVRATHSSGIDIYASPRDDQEPLSVTCISELREILNYLQQTYDIVLIDNCYVEEYMIELMLLNSDRVLLIGNLDIPSLKGFVTALNKFAKYKFEPNHIGIIINRYDSKNRLDIREFEKKAGHHIAAKLPNDYGACIESINRGQPVIKLAPSSSISTEIKKLAKMIIESGDLSQKGTTESTSQKDETVKSAKKGLFGWLL